MGALSGSPYIDLDDGRSRSDSSLRHLSKISMLLDVCFSEDRRQDVVRGWRSERSHRYKQSAW